MAKLKRGFYQQPAIKIVKKFLGKFLVYNSPKGKLIGEITDVEAYPAFVDETAHGNKRTKRTEILFKRGGYAYIYLIYGVHYLLGVSVNKKYIPDVVFIRAVKPILGMKLMKKNFGRKPKNMEELTDRPGKLCKSYGITKELNGTDMTGKVLYIEDRGVRIKLKNILSSSRIGISPKLKGYKSKLRFYLKKKEK